MQRHVDEVPWVRSVQVTSTRSPPKPSLPDGPAHRLEANYYYSRDARSEMLPPMPVESVSEVKRLSSAQDKATT